ncbi:MAG: hypothetical protein MJ174_10110 [Treponema sp.]|nr:hypothetical protein [Treponema sp.]
MKKLLIFRFMTFLLLSTFFVFPVTAQMLSPVTKAEIDTKKACAVEITDLITGTFNAYCICIPKETPHTDFSYHYEHTFVIDTKNNLYAMSVPGEKKEVNGSISLFDGFSGSQDEQFFILTKDTDKWGAFWREAEIYCIKNGIASKIHFCKLESSNNDGIKKSTLALKKVNNKLYLIQTEWESLCSNEGMFLISVYTLTPSGNSYSVNRTGYYCLTGSSDIQFSSNQDDWYYTLNDTHINMRTEPSLNGAKIITLEGNEHLKYLDVYPETTSVGGKPGLWIKMEATATDGASYRGYVWPEYLTTSDYDPSLK